MVKLYKYTLKRKFFYVFFCYAILSTALCAQERDFEVVNGMTWYLTKKDAIEVALEQEKYVLLMWGHRSCHRCEEFKKDAAWCFLHPIISKHYVLWYADGDIFARNSPELSDYFSSYPEGTIPQPILCVINPSDSTKAYGHRNGAYDIDDLMEMLDSSVGNDILSDFDKIKMLVYVSGNNLLIQCDFKDEIVTVYSVTGSIIDRFNKTGYSFSRGLSTYPKGVLIVAGESGWVRKIAIR